MATYNQERGFRSILNAALGEYQSKGFQLIEPDDHILELYYHDDLVSVLSQGGATLPAIHKACREYLETLAG